MSEEGETGTAEIVTDFEQVIPDTSLQWGRLKNAAAFSLFRGLQMNNPLQRKQVKKWYVGRVKKYEIHDIQMFYVVNTTAMCITKDGPFCVKVMNKDKKAVAKFIRNEPKRSNKQTGLASLFGCCSDTEDRMEVLDDNGKVIATSFLHHDQFRGIEIVIKDPTSQVMIKIRSSRDQKDAFAVVGPDNRFLGEIRQKIISSANFTFGNSNFGKDNAIENLKGVACWCKFSRNFNFFKSLINSDLISRFSVSPEVPLNIKVFFMAAAFLIEIDYFSETKSRQTPFLTPEADYQIFFRRRRKDKIQNPQKNQVVNRWNPKRKLVRLQTISLKLILRNVTVMMPEIHHIKNFDPIGGEEQVFVKKEKVEEFKQNETTKEEMDVNGMTREQFKKAAIKVVEYLMRQDENIRAARCSPALKPGYLKALLPTKAPMKAEDIDDILDDYNKLIVPGLSHSSHPNFHSFYPSGNPFHCLLADLLGGHIGDAGFYWTSNPALTELEVIMMDWLGEMMALPKEFLLFPEGSRGGGCMQRSDTESNFLVLVAARTDMIQRMKQRDKKLRSSDILARLVAYTSSDARRSIKKAAEVAMVKMRVLPTDENFILRGDTLHAAMVADIERGLIPFFVCANFGTSGPCSFDHLHELGPVCRDHGTWLHVDAAYAGTALICPETRSLMRGIDWADSFCTTPSKLILAVCDVCCLWVRDRLKLQLASLENHPDLPFKGLPTSQRVGALKIWFMIRSFGVENLQNQLETYQLGQSWQNTQRFEI
ncbi:hypothetical protein CAEBREN_31617 [Caenorhabditis brenneri]|uniref:Uncharacterized protein n=1 Tax=Caenorhabditis brenneri TaxID=135651 RepID=G0NYL7_CAEBE|nr:hypothetical protein CAEBREN_31617 [Caenorhabditis brenneri]